MRHGQLPLDLALASACGVGAAFIVWRLAVSIRAGSIWLRGQKVTRHEEPVWFWAYVGVYSMMIGVMLYGVEQAVNA
jgi:hypothetical protein